MVTHDRISINTPLEQGDTLMFLIDNRSLQHIALRFEFGIHSEPVLQIDRE